MQRPGPTRRMGEDDPGQGASTGDGSAGSSGAGGSGGGGSGGGGSGGGDDLGSDSSLESTATVVRRDDGPPLPPELAVGSLVAGRYDLVGVIGRGGFGVVFQALDRRTNEHVALKMQRLPGPGAAARMRRAARILSGLRHPALMRGFACGRIHGFEYAVMEWHEGAPNLEEVLHAEGPLAWEHATRLTLQVLEGLAHLHERRVLHRDVKPANVLLTEAGAVLIDFDLALELDAEDDAGPSAPVPDDRQLSGTPLYMTLERLQGEPCTPDVDVYAAALVLYKLLCARLPTDHPRRPLCLRDLLEARLRPPRSLREMGAVVPRPLEAALLRALDPDPARRFPSALALGDALNEALVATDDGWTDEG